jgi:hypothetical protein
MPPCNQNDATLV